jgi:L-glyceraldehyde reductase
LFIRAFKSGDNLFPVDAEGFFQHADIDPSVTYAAMEKLVDAGKVRAIGISNFSRGRMDDLLAKVRIPPAVNQVELHPYFGQPDFIAYCRSKNILVEAYSPLGNNQTGDARPVDDPRVAELAKDLGLDVGQLLYSWGVQRGTVVLPKSVTPSRIRSNLAVVELPADAVAKLDAMEKNSRLHWQHHWGYDIFQEVGADKVKELAKAAAPTNLQKFG